MMNALKSLAVIGVVIALLLNGATGFAEIAGESLNKPLMEVPFKIVLAGFGGLLLGAIIINMVLTSND